MPRNPNAPRGNVALKDPIPITGESPERHRQTQQRRRAPVRTNTRHQRGERELNFARKSTTRQTVQLQQQRQRLQRQQQTEQNSDDDGDNDSLVSDISGLNIGDPLADARHQTNVGQPSTSGLATSNQEAEQLQRSTNIQSRRKQLHPNRIPPVLREMKKLQMGTQLIIPKLPFSRVVREILQQQSIQPFRITPTAFAALQETAEIYLVQLFEDAYRCTLHRDRVTLAVKDVQLVRFLRGISDIGAYRYQ